MILPLLSQDLIKRQQAGVCKLATS